MCRRCSRASPAGCTCSRISRLPLGPQRDCRFGPCGISRSSFSTRWCFSCSERSSERCSPCCAENHSLQLFRIGAIIAGVAILTRLLWVPLLTALRMLSRQHQHTSRVRRAKGLFLVSWTSMRGVVSLATALALPRTLGNGSPFPYRKIILITMCVIVLTLVIQGLSLEPIIRAFRFEPEHEPVEEERLARREATRRGAEALDDLAHEDWVDQRDVDVLRAEVRERARMTEVEGGEPRRSSPAASRDDRRRTANAHSTRGTKARSPTKCCAGSSRAGSRVSSRGCWRRALSDKVILRSEATRDRCLSMACCRF